MLVLQYLFFNFSKHGSKHHFCTGLDNESEVGRFEATAETSKRNIGLDIDRLAELHYVEDIFRGDLCFSRKMQR